MQGLNGLPLTDVVVAPARGRQLTWPQSSPIGGRGCRRRRCATSTSRSVVAPILISGLGLLMIYSATHTSLEQDGGDPLNFVKRQAVAIVLGIAAMAIMTVIDYRRLRELALFGYGDHGRHARRGARSSVSR